MLYAHLLTSPLNLVNPLWNSLDEELFLFIIYLHYVALYFVHYWGQNLISVSNVKPDNSFIHNE